MSALHANFVQSYSLLCKYDRIIQMEFRTSGDSRFRFFVLTPQTIENIRSLSAFAYLAKRDKCEKTSTFSKYFCLEI
jgi:hypothetical protein